MSPPTSPVLTSPFVQPVQATPTAPLEPEETNIKTKATRAPAAAKPKKVQRKGPMYSDDEIKRWINTVLKDLPDPAYDFWCFDWKALCAADPKAQGRMIDVVRKVFDTNNPDALVAYRKRVLDNDWHAYVTPKSDDKGKTIWAGRTVKFGTPAPENGANVALAVLKRLHSGSVECRLWKIKGVVGPVEMTPAAQPGLSDIEKAPDVESPTVAALTAAKNRQAKTALGESKLWQQAIDNARVIPDAPEGYESDDDFERAS